MLKTHKVSPFKFIFLVYFVVCVKSEFNLTILHVNDIHVHFEESNKYSGRCKELEECFGGIPRLKTEVDSILEPNKIFLNGGDMYQGNEWYTFYKWTVVAHFSNLLNFTVMALGNHEFDDTASGLVPFLQNVSFPVVSSNVDVTKEPSLQGLFSPSTVLTVSGVKIGVIGYTTTDTENISNAGSNIKFNDEIKSIALEAKRLKEVEKIPIIIALGHSGYVKDQEIAREIPELDIVVGGHSHTFLYSASALPSNEIPVGDYPTIVTQASGKKVPVVQAFAYTKYLGHINLHFNDEFEVVSWSGQPRLLSSSIPQDENLLSELKPWKEGLTTLSDEILGYSDVVLTSTRQSESNLGNFLADALIHQYKDRNVQLSLFASGGIRGTLSNGSITMADITNILPFKHTIDLVSLQGQHIRSVFERSVHRFEKDGTNTVGGFLQVGGFQVQFDITRPVNHRVLNVLVINSEGRFEAINKDKIYKIVIPSLLNSGGDSHDTLKNHIISREIGPLDRYVLANYVKNQSPIYKSALEDRIIIYTPNKRPQHEESYYDNWIKYRHNKPERDETFNKTTIENNFTKIRNQTLYPFNQSSSSIIWRRLLHFWSSSFG